MNGQHNKPNVTVVPTKDGYDRWSEIYEEDGNPLILLEESHVARSLGDVAVLSVLDVGCGTGRHSVRLAQPDFRHPERAIVRAAQITIATMLFSARFIGNVRLIEHNQVQFPIYRLSVI